MIKEAEAERIALNVVRSRKPVSRKADGGSGGGRDGPGPRRGPLFAKPPTKKYRETIGPLATRSDGTTAGIEVTRLVTEPRGRWRLWRFRGRGRVGGEPVPGERPAVGRAKRPGGPFAGSATEEKERFRGFFRRLSLRPPTRKRPLGTPQPFPSQKRPRRGVRRRRRGARRGADVRKRRRRRPAADQGVREGRDLLPEPGAHARGDRARGGQGARRRGRSACGEARGSRTSRCPRCTDAARAAQRADERRAPPGIQRPQRPRAREGGVREAPGTDAPGDARLS